MFAWTLWLIQVENACPIQRWHPTSSWQHHGKQYQVGPTRIHILTLDSVPLSPNLFWLVHCAFCQNHSNAWSTVIKLSDSVMLFDNDIVTQETVLWNMMLILHRMTADCKRSVTPMKFLWEINKELWKVPWPPPPSNISTRETSFIAISNLTTSSWALESMAIISMSSIVPWPETHFHIPYWENKNLTGTARYTSSYIKSVRLGSICHILTWGVGAFFGLTCFDWYTVHFWLRFTFWVGS